MKDAAALLDRNVGLVDVGCLQVDLYHHPHAFKSLRAAFDPAANADYAARHLVGLLEQTGSWTAAAAAYHSGDATLGDPYLARVLYYWKQLGTTAASAAAAPDDPGRHGFLIEDGPSPLDVAADFFARKDYASALAIYRASLANRPDDQAALLGVALCLRQTGRDEDALVYLQKALTIDPTNPAALGTLLRLIDEGPAGRKLARLTSARQVAPQSPPILSRLAFEEAAAGRLSEALADMAAAARLAPDDPIILLDAALLLDRLDQPSAAVKAYELFLRTYRPESAALSIPLKEIRDRQAYLQRGGH